MFAHILDHCIFSARWKDRTKRVAFGVVAFVIVANFWWFRGVAWGIEGPINDHWGLLWRKVCAFIVFDLFLVLMVVFGTVVEHLQRMRACGAEVGHTITDRMACRISICSSGLAMSLWLNPRMSVLGSCFIARCQGIE